LIAQTLHGYDQGHRLLAHGGTLDEDELAQLDRLSDLSGYVPLGTEFDHYYTGFPCGRYYAFACTWPDRAATRAGTVLTHTLLIPRQSVGKIQDLWNVPGHRRPASAFDRKPYEVPLPVELDSLQASAQMPSLERAAAAIVLWFGQAERPVLWTEEGGAEDVVRYLWSLLWQETRESFSFCTFSLQVRYLRRQPFGFLALPPSAVGSFHDRARSVAWWLEGQLADPTLRERTNQSWVRTILEKGVDATQTMARYCIEHNLPPLEPVAYPVFHRFSELEAPAKLRLTAARSRMDLLERLWPSLDPQHSLVKATLAFVVQHQPDAPMAPRPFWDLIDIVKRPSVTVLVENDSDFAAHLASTITNETQRRIVEAQDMAGLGELLRAAKHVMLRGAIATAVGRAFALMSNETIRITKGSALLLAAVSARASDLMSTFFLPLSSADRVAISVHALEHVPSEDQSTLADYVLTAAKILDEIAIVIDVWCKLGQPLRALADATAMVLDKPDVRPEPLTRILDRLTPEQRLDWALAVADPRLASWAGKRGSMAATELRLSLPALTERCSGQANANHVLLAYLEGLSMSSVKDEDLFHSAIAAILEKDRESTGTKRLAETIAPRLVSRAARDGDVSDVASWFTLESIQKALANASEWTLFSGYQSARAWEAQCLPNLARVLAMSTRTRRPTSLVWLTHVLGKPLQDAMSTSFSRSIHDLVVLIESPHEIEGWSILAAQLLLAVRRNRGAQSYLLVERIFPVLYPALVQNALDSATTSLLRSVIWRDWDIAKNWRHWLLDVWLGERWPAASFLRCLGDDIALFRRIAYRAWHKEKEKDFVRNLSSAWIHDDALAQQWRGPVNRFLANPDAKTDYE